MAYILDESHHYDTETVTDLVLGAIVAAPEDNKWSLLIPPSPLRRHHGHAVVVDDKFNVSFEHMLVAATPEANSPKMLGQYVENAMTITYIKQGEGSSALYKLALKNDIPGGTSGNPSSMYRGRYGTTSTGEGPKWIEFELNVPPHNLLQPPDNDGKHTDTENYTPPAAGDIIIGMVDKWGHLSLGTGYLIYEGGDGDGNKVKWAELGTDPQDIVVYQNGAYQLKNDIDSTDEERFYGAIVSDAGVNIGWHVKTADDGCKDGGTGGDAACCPTALNYDEVKDKTFTFTLMFKNNLSSDKTDFPVTIKLKQGSTEQTVSGTGKIDSTNSHVIKITLEIPVPPFEYNDDASKPPITVQVIDIDDSVICTDSKGNKTSAKVAITSSNDCKKSVEIKIYSDGTTGGDSSPKDPPGTACTEHPALQGYRVSVSGNSISIQLSFSSHAIVSAVSLISINDNNVNATLGTSQDTGKCHINITFGGNFNEALVRRNQNNKFCFGVSYKCCSTHESTKTVTSDFCVIVFIDENGNGTTTVDIPVPPREPPPGAPTGNCDPAPVLKCLGITINGGNVVAQFEASRLVTLPTGGDGNKFEPLGAFTITDITTGQAVANGQVVTKIFSNQAASKNVIAVGNANVNVPDDKCYKVCVSPGQLACWDKPDVLSAAEPCCSNIGKACPNQPGGGQPGGPGGGGAGPQNGGDIDLQNCNAGDDDGGFGQGDKGDGAGGTTTGVYSGCHHITLSPIRRSVLLNIRGQWPIAVIIPRDTVEPQGLDNLPDAARNKFNDAQYTFTPKALISLTRNNNGRVQVGKYTPQNKGMYTHDMFYETIADGEIELDIAMYAVQGSSTMDWDANIGINGGGNMNNQAQNVALKSQTWTILPMSHLANSMASVTSEKEPKTYGITYAHNNDMNKPYRENSLVLGKFGRMSLFDTELPTTVKPYDILSALGWSYSRTYALYTLMPVAKANDATFKDIWSTLQDDDGINWNNVNVSVKSTLCLFVL